MRTRCSVCGKLKNEKSFAWRIKGEKRHGRCRDCHRKYRRKHYLANREKYIEKARKRNEWNRKELYKKIYDYLLEHPCESCGENALVVLDFHHKKGKGLSIPAMVMRQFPWAKIMEEIKKCKVLCANCHRKVTAKQFGWFRRVHSLTR